MATSSGHSSVGLAHIEGKTVSAARPPTLQKGRVQKFQGYVWRQTSILKRWKKILIGIEPGESDTIKMVHIGNFLK